MEGVFFNLICADRGFSWCNHITIASSPHRSTMQTKAQHKEIHMSDGIHQPGGNDGMTLAQAQELYKFVGFAAPFVVVRRKSDNRRGTLEFQHNPRVYFGFQEA